METTQKEAIKATQRIRHDRESGVSNLSADIIMESEKMCRSKERMKTNQMSILYHLRMDMTQLKEIRHILRA